MKTHTGINRNALAAILAPAVLLVACGASDASAEAKTLSETNAIFVQGEKCVEGVTAALAERNIGVTSSREKANATLKLDIASQGRNLDEVPEFGGFGHKAAYSATLTGAEEKILFSTAGDEGSTTHNEMCEDIGDEIASRLKDRMNS